MSHALDRPVWNALTTVHAALALGGDLARRYSPAIHPFAATRDENPESLRSLAGIAAAGETLMFLQADEFVLPPGFSTVLADFGVQMVAEQPFPATADDRIVRLGDADAAAMLELATLTRPGPFTLRALALGEFWGVKENGRLVAMAGERLKQEGLTEISGVCSHPGCRGRGLARLLSLHVAGRISARGEVPFLHAFATNDAAIGLYRSIGFRLRTRMYVAAIVRQG